MIGDEGVASGRMRVLRRKAKCEDICVDGGIVILTIIQHFYQASHFTLIGVASMEPETLAMT